MTSSPECAVTGVGYKGFMGETEDPFNLHRFVSEQNLPKSSFRSTYKKALQELQQGQKTSHWVWYVFPQLLFGSSKESMDFAISGLAEARAYLAHPDLGPRLHECIDALLQAESNDARFVMGSGTDKMKLKSSMTLFLRADPTDPVFQQVLDKYFEGEPDEATDKRLGLA